MMFYVCEKCGITVSPLLLNAVLAKSHKKRVGLKRETHKCRPCYECKMGNWCNDCEYRFFCYTSCNEERYARFAFCSGVTTEEEAKHSIEEIKKEIRILKDAIRNTYEG